MQTFAPEAIRQNWIVNNENCAPYCPSPCYHWTTVKQGEYAGATAFGPEYETIYAFGSNLENPRFDSIIAAYDLCDLLGLDTMSAGLTIGWATECFERGILSKKDTDGIDMCYGNHKMLLELLHKITYRQGIEDLLAEGSQRAAAKIGQGSDAGFGRADDRLPSRLLNEPLPDGPNRGKVVPLEALKDEFYESCGWDGKTGFPRTETLQRLGIELRP